MADFLSTVFGGGAEKEAADRDRAIAAQYQAQALPALQQGYTTGSQAINQGIGAYTPLANLGAQYSSVAPTLTGALGVGTPDQIAAARGAFKTDPGYDFMKGQMLDALARQRSIGGMGASGNADIDAMTYAGGLADQTYQNWIKNLQSTGQMGISATGTAAGGQAAGYGKLSDLAQQYAQSQTGVYGGVAGADIGASNLQGAGEAAGAKNLLNFGMNLASMALGIPGGGGGGGGGSSLLSSLGSGLSGLGSQAYGTLMGPQWQQSNPGAWGSSYYGPVRG
jgi:hypothetical protein